MSQPSYRSAADDPYAEPAGEADQTEDPSPGATGSDLEADEADAAEQRRDANNEELEEPYTRPLPEDADPADAWDQDREVQHDEDDDYR